MTSLNKKTLRSKMQHDYFLLKQLVYNICTIKCSQMDILVDSSFKLALKLHEFLLLCLPHLWFANLLSGMSIGSFLHQSQSSASWRLDASFLHVLPILSELPPGHGEDDGHQQDQAAGYQVSNRQEVVLASEPGQRGQHHFLSALEVLHREVWRGRRSRLICSR